MYTLYSQRLKDASGEPEVFKYNEFPPSFRNQFYTIVSNVLLHQDPALNLIPALCKVYAQEKGLKSISGNNYPENNSLAALQRYIDTCNSQDLIDFMDFIFGYFISNHKVQQEYYVFCDNFSKGAIKELNLRLKQHQLGYEFTNGQIIVKTNTFAHKNIVKPSLVLLADEEFRGAEDEYLAAFDRFRSGQNKDAILNAAKAFESVMKPICLGLGYPFDEKRATIKPLVEILKTQSFFPAYLETHLSTICTALETGAATVRNKETGHGQGSHVEAVGDEYVEYVLNLVASNIIFLYKLYQKKKQEASLK